MVRENIRGRQLPFVSVIVPVRNEQNSIRECLQRLLDQTYPSDRFEVLAIDGMSEDGTREIVQAFICGNGHPTVRLLDNPKKQRSPALNVGIRHATGEVIVRVDARTIIPHDYVEKCVRTLLETGADNVGGVQKPIIDKLKNRGNSSQTQFAVGLAMSHFFGIGNAQFRLGKQSGYVDTVYLGCFKRETFDKVGLFDEDSAVIGEDTDMNYRIRKAGGKVYLDKDIVAYYCPRDNLKDLWRLYFRYGGARAGNFLKTGKFTSWRQLVPLFFLTALVVSAIASLLSVGFLWLFISLASVYLAADFVVSAHLSIKHARPGLLFVLPLVFGCMHCAWATGFFRRLFQQPKPGEYWGH